MPESEKRKKTDAVPHQRVPAEAAPSPRWWAPTMVTLMVLGLAWVVVTYLARGAYPIPDIGNWNLAVGFGIMLVGFVMTLRWR